MFVGRYEHAVDAKGRLALPSKLRESLRYEGERNIFYICRGPNDCLRMYTEREWDNVVKEATSASGTAEEVLDNNRLLFSSVEKVTVDGQGRILLPTFLKNIAAITKDVMIIGMITFVEIWDKNKWDEFESAKGPGFTGVAYKPSSCGPSGSPQTAS